MEARRQEIQTNIAERQATLQKNAQQRITNLAANISNRMEAAIRRIENVILRLESRIEKLRAQGVATEEASRALAAARTDIERARQTLATIDTDVRAAVTSNDPRTTWERVRAIYQTTHGFIRSAHQNIRIAIDALKQAVRTTSETNGAPDAVRSASADVTN
jgi:exonuclease VII small subunit